MSGKLAYNYAEAAAATGLSETIIRRAVRAGDLAAVKPKVDGKTVEKALIPADALMAWLNLADAS